MSLAERVANGGNVLVLDIERMKGRAEVEFWSLGDYKNRRIHYSDVTEWPRTICVAWQFYGTKRIEFAAEWQQGGREAMACKAWHAYDRAEIVVGHNVAAFDTKHLNSDWRDLGLPPPSPFKTVDTLKVGRRMFGDESMTLGALCERLGIPTKTDKYDVEVARAACDGNRAAQRKLAAYNRGDILASCALYDRMRGWVPNHPHALTGTADDRITCNQCWGDNLTRTGTRLAQQITYVLYRCQDCGANVSGTRHSRAATTRGVA